MSYIPCSANCRYQNDGLCALDHAGAAGMAADGGCVHFVPSSGALRNARFHAAPPQYLTPQSVGDP